MPFTHINFYTFFDSLFVCAFFFFTWRGYQVPPVPGAMIIHENKVLLTFFCPDTINNKLNFQLNKHKKKVR